MKRLWKTVFFVLVGIVVLLVSLMVAESFFGKMGPGMGSPCGISTTSDFEVDCLCDGKMYDVVKTGVTEHICRGECSECRCYEVDLALRNRTEVDCSDYPLMFQAGPVTEPRKDHTPDLILPFQNSPIMQLCFS